MEQAPLSARQARYRREQQRKKQRNRFFAFSFCVILVLAGIITAIIDPPGKAQKAETTSAASDGAVSVETGSGADAQQNLSGAQADAGAAGTAGDTVDDAAGAVSETPADAQPAATGGFGPVLHTDITYTALAAPQIALPENGRVDVAYFDDALFIGDSITQGFEVYSSGITNAHYAAYLGAGPKQLMSGTVTNLNGELVQAIDEILAAAPKKVYILLGTNSLSTLKDEAFVKYYTDFLDYLSPQLPKDTVYYLQAIPPVTEEKSAGDESYSAARIQQLNAQIAQMAYRRGWHYLDLYTTMADEAGNLRADYTTGTDGVHFNSEGYAAWKDFLLTHAAYSAANPYIAGSPYMTAG